MIQRNINSKQKVIRSVFGIKGVDIFDEISFGHVLDLLFLDSHIVIIFVVFIHNVLIDTANQPDIVVDFYVPFSYGLESRFT
jgi:hypothetical protein